MTKAVAEPEIVKREVGERVKLNLHFDKEVTKDLGDGIFEAVITTNAIDRHNESIVTEGIDTQNYMAKNPVVLYGHDYFGLPIGKTLKLTEMKNKIKAKFQLAISDYDFAATVANLIKSGVLNAVSIGGVVRKWSDDYRTIEEMEMVEFSVVSIPSNSDAIITARSFEAATGKSMDAVAKEYEEFSNKAMLDKLKRIDNDEVSQGIKFLENLIFNLKESHAATSSAGEAEPETVKRVKKVRLLQAAKALNRESERVVRIVKLKS